MFKGILPASKRISTSEFTIVTPPEDPGKENYNGFPQVPASQPSNKPFSKRKSRAQAADQPAETNQAFDKLLDELQIPSTIRPKLIGMESSVKAAMLKSQQTLASAPQPTTPRGMRKAHSSDSISTSPHERNKSGDYEARPPGRSAGNSFADASVAHSRGYSVDVSRVASRPNTPFGGDASKLKNKEKLGKVVWTPGKFCAILDSTSSALLEIETVKKLRLLLRNEAASWTEEFLQEGGYDCLLSRLNEILEFEWREEQHDDQVLHALLQCFKALSTSDAGCAAIRASFPSPFLQLFTLLYSDKKPGEVATRQLIVEFIMLLFELYPSSSIAGQGENDARRREIWEPQDIFAVKNNLVFLPYPHKSVFSLIRSLLLTPAPKGAEAPDVELSPHEFIESIHTPRVYKTFLRELSDICRDYFWVFCHPNNAIWNLRECDEIKAERPRAPGGMTGGVEAEAMRYMTLHFKFLNMIANSVAELNLPKEHEHSAYTFHSNLFLSGLERMILIARKASTVYYPTLHLEIARFIHSAGMARYELPWSVGRLIGSPPTAMCKSPVPASAKNTSPSKRTGGEAPPPFLPLVGGGRKVTPMNFMG